MRLAMILCALAAPAFGEGNCPPLPDREEEKAALYDQLRLARDAGEAQRLAGELWRIWLDAPDEEAQAMLDLAIGARVAGRLDRAVDLLDRLVAYCPAYAEGWNQRAFARFLDRDFAAALADLDEALRLDPRHLGALSGRALTLLGLGRTEEARAVLREALKLNPYMPERALLLTDPPGTVL